MGLSWWVGGGLVACVRRERTSEVGWLGGWGCKRLLPKSVNKEDWKAGGFNDALRKYVHAFLWRHHLSVDADLKKQLCHLK